MKIAIDNVDLSSTTGPNTFAKRFVESLHSYGHSIVNVNEKNDITLVFIEPTQQPRKDSKVIHRLDGIWFKPDEFKYKNVNIKFCYDRSDGVVFQSNFDKTMIEKFWGCRKNRIIHNGIKKTDTGIDIQPELAKIRKTFDNIFVCSANWHPQKRLQTNVDLYEHIRKENDCLIVLGNNPVFKRRPPKNTFVTGGIDQRSCLEVYSVSDWMIHLAYLDHCPNTVVEAISQGVPVICSDTGGTRELVNEFGVILQEEEKYDYVLFDYDNPPDLNVKQLQQLPKKQELGNHINIDIVNTTNEYIEFFNEVLSL